jgi:hypothetical protein
MTRAVTRRPTFFAALAALLAVSAVLVVTKAGTASAGITWSAVNPPLPSDAVAGQGLTYASSSCPVAGWCIAVGDYLGHVGTTYYEPGLIAAESGSAWTAIAAPLPANAAADPQALLQSVSCAAAGSCVAVGRYLDTSGATQGLVDQLSSGVWTPTEISLPAGSLVSGTSADAQLTDVVCASATSCTAVGVYALASGSQQALVDNEVGGNWVPAAAPLPAAATGSQFLSLACPAAGSCVAAGTFEVGGIFLGFVDTLAGGTWTATALPVPAGTSSLASIANDYLSVVCSDASHCAIAGTTFDGNYEGLLDTLSGGTWTATAVATPDGSPSTDVQLTSLDCTDANDCVAGGFYLESGAEQGLFDTLASGTWTPSTAPTPAGTPAGANIEVHDMACPAAGSCDAVGQSDVNGSQTGLFWNLSSGTWVVTPTPLPADASAGSDPSFAPLTCPGAGVCIAVGTYLGSGGREGVVETDPSLAASTTTVNVTAVSNTVLSYSASVSSAAGNPTGTVVFSDGLSALCGAVVSNGTATCSGPIPTTKTILASYSGDNVTAPSWGTGTSPAVPAAFTSLSASIEAAKINTFFGGNLRVLVTDGSGAGVPGVVVTFTLPPPTVATAVPWSSTTVLTNSSGIALSPYLSANGKTGSYWVTATANGMTNIVPFILSNVKS